MAQSRFAKVLIGSLAGVGALAVLGAVGFVLGGISARPDPPALEVKLARAARHRLIPGAARRRANPVQSNAEVLEEGREHWADHCASCHGNDGKGDTDIGRGLYPRAPDMTLPATQDLSDGELFWIIENGIKLTGMPAWGSDSGEDEEDSEDSWELVHFIRHLPQINEGELKEMRRYNPVSRDELEEERETERFLAGGSEPSHREDEDHHHGRRRRRRGRH